MYLLDTNIILELLLDQDHADQVAAFLNQAAPNSLHVSEFSLYSIGIILLRLKRYDLFLRSLKDLFLSEAIGLLRLGLDDIQKVIEVGQTFGLDFDDSYQYVTAEKFNLELLSFDRDFDRTPLGRKTP
ncbi:MAG: PIN domain-containing protein [Deltaproteobacteria bacterium]